MNALAPRPILLRTHNGQVLLVLLLFAFLGWVRHLHNYGEDLASSYIGCRLLAADGGQHLYSHSLSDFREVNDPVWDAMATRTGYAPLRLLHPYVQTPLWAYSLQPLCTRMNFRSFCDGFLVLFMLCLAGTLWLVARYWTPALLHPVWMALLCFGLYRSEPFKYAIFLAQTHILYLFLTVLALILAQRRQPVGGGVLLALAAAVKITPGFVFFYWLATRRYKAALVFLLASGALFGTTLLAVGPGLTRTWLETLRSDANILLLAFNNQSFAAWWMSLSAPSAAALNWKMYKLPAGLKAVSLGLTVASSILGGFLDRRRPDFASSQEVTLRPYGAAFALLGATLFAPLAWTHYFLLLVIPVMFFAQSWSDRKAWAMWICIAVVFLLNVYPISFGAVHFLYGRFTLIRSQLYAGIFSMLVLCMLGIRQLAPQNPPALPGKAATD